MLKADELLKVDLEQFDKVATGYYDVEFANGVERVSKKRLLYSMYMWPIALGLPIMKEFLIPEGTYSASDFNNTGSLMVEYVFRTKKMSHALQYEISKAITVSNNNIYNNLGLGKTNYLSSICILDLIELQDDQRLIDAMTIIDKENTPKSIKDAYAVLDTIIHSEKFRYNPVVVAFLAKAINYNQLQQVVGPRGAVTNILGDIYNKMVSSSFTLGMRNIYELTIEAQGGGAKALSRSTEAIQSSEHFGRLMQLFTMLMKGIEFTDCGTTKRKEWFVKKEDLPSLQGKEYICPDTGAVKNIKITDTHLDGKKIIYRDVSCCTLYDKTKVCSHCMGDIAYSIMLHTNLGFVSSAILTLLISQNNLSTKHLTKSAVAMKMALRKDAAKYLRVKDNALSIKPEHKTKKMELWLKTEDCYLVKDLTSDNVDSMPIERIAAITEVRLKVTIKGNEEFMDIPIGAVSNRGRLTRRFLRHMTEGNFRLSGDYYIVDISSYGTTPMVELNEKEFDFALMGSELSSMFINIGNNRNNKGETTPDEFLTKLFTLVNSKLTVNVGFLEVMVYVFTARDIANHDYDLSRNSKAVTKLVGMNDLISRRSAGAWFSFDRIARRLVDPRIFVKKEITTHPQDYLLVPELMLRQTHKIPTFKSLKLTPIK